MRENSVKTLMEGGGKAVNAWMSMPSAFAAEVMGHAGFDSITIDLQHGIVDYQTAVTMLQALSSTPVTPICRVPWLEPGIVMKVLDAGAYGVICPMVNTAEDAARLVSYMNYAPKGQRSFGPSRAVLYAGADYAAQANDTVLSLAMIETKEAYANREAILATEGLSGVYVGPSDLGLSHGFVPKLDREEPEMLAKIEAILKTAKDNGRLAGIHCLDPGYAKGMHEMGFDLVTLASDSRLMAQAATEGIATIRGG